MIHELVLGRLWYRRERWKYYQWQLQVLDSPAIAKDQRVENQELILHVSALDERDAPEKQDSEQETGSSRTESRGRYTRIYGGEEKAGRK